MALLRFLAFAQTIYCISYFSQLYMKKEDQLSPYTEDNFWTDNRDDGGT